MKSKFLKYTMLLNFLLMISNNTYATSSRTYTMNVQANVPGQATVAVNSMNFSSYATTAASTAIAAITITATNKLNYTIDLDGGINYSAPTRRMSNTGVTPTDYLNYNIYQDSANTKVWGTAVSTGTAVTGIGNGTNQTINAYGTAPAGQASSVGSYTDTVTVTVTY